MGEASHPARSGNRRRRAAAAGPPAARQTAQHPVQHMSHPSVLGMGVVREELVGVVTEVVELACAAAVLDVEPAGGADGPVAEDALDGGGPVLVLVARRDVTEPARLVEERAA